MRKAVLLGIVILACVLVVSLASAKLVGYLSNSVTATVTVLPPEPPEEPDMPMKLSDCVPPVAHNNYGWMKYVDENNETIFRGPNQCLRHVIMEVCKSDDNPFKNPGLCVAAGAPGRQMERAIDSCLYDYYEDEEGFFECVTEYLAPGQSSSPAPSAVEENITEDLVEDVVEEKDELEEDMKEESKEKDELEEEKPEEEDGFEEESEEKSEKDIDLEEDDKEESSEKEENSEKEDVNEDELSEKDLDEVKESFEDDMDEEFEKELVEDDSEEEDLGVVEDDE